MTTGEVVPGANAELLDTNDRAGERTDDADDRLNLRYHEVSKCVDIRCFCGHDDIVWTCDGFGRVNTIELADFTSDI